MSLVFRRVVDTYSYINNDLSDPRSNDLFLLNPFVLFTICMIYYKFVKEWGPAFMKNREPYKIESIIIVYNILQIVLCALVTYKSIEIVWWSGHYSLICQPLNWEETPMEYLIIKYVRYYFYLKILDLLDTVFFVLRKKNKHVSFLHVYHHMLMVFSGAVSLKYIPAGHGTMVGTVNCFVHSVMYSYYLLTIMYPQYKKSIWWKKHITQLQICQFLFLLIHMVHPLFQSNCTYPKWISIAFFPQNLFMTFLFGDFYYKEYIMKKNN